MLGVAAGGVALVTAVRRWRERQHLTNRKQATAASHHDTGLTRWTPVNSRSELLERLREYRSVVHRELTTSVLPFWLNYSLDYEAGGYFNCLDPSGVAYDHTKHMWLQCREVYMMATLANEKGGKILSAEQRQAVASAAQHGAAFIWKHAQDNRSTDEVRNTKSSSPSLVRCFFSVDRHGRGIYTQRKLFTECFFVMAAITHSRADPAILEASGVSGADWQDRALRTFESVLRMAKDPSLLGRGKYPGAPPLKSLAVPMILVNVIDVIRQALETPPVRKSGNQSFSSIVPPNLYAKEMDWCIREIQEHVDHRLRVVRENVLDLSAASTSSSTSSSSSPFLDETSDGRLLNPGHVIECGWFLLRICERYLQPQAASGDAAAAARAKSVAADARAMIEWSFVRGWDTDENGGGILYFQDALDRPLVPLEATMKLWWPHCEAIIAFAYLFTQDSASSSASSSALSATCQQHLARFHLVLEYTLRTFRAPGGEWYGYADRSGQVTSQIVGGPYKGAFHVPRCLLIATQLLDQAIARIESTA